MVHQQKKQFKVAYVSFSTITSFRVETTYRASYLWLFRSLPYHPSHSKCLVFYHINCFHCCLSSLLRLFYLCGEVKDFILNINSSRKCEFLSLSHRMWHIMWKFHVQICQHLQIQLLEWFDHKMFCLFDCLIEVFRPTREIFTHLETSALV